MTCKEFVAIIPGIKTRTNAELAAMMRHMDKCSTCRSFVKAGAKMGVAVNVPAPTREECDRAVAKILADPEH